MKIPVSAHWLCALVLLFLWGCGNADTASTRSPKKLTVGLLVAEGSERTFEKMDILTRYFSKKLGMEVKQIQITNPSAMIEAMRAKKIDVGSGGAFTYLVASKNAGAEAIITTATADGNPQFYNSCLITSATSGINSIDEVLKNPQQYTLAWAYPTSTSGHLVPRYFMQQKGVMPENFKEVFTSTDHAATVLSAASGKVDVAAVMYATLERFITLGRVKRSDVKVLWTSEPIVEGPIFVRKDLDPALKKRIQQAYVDMEKEDPEAREVLRTQYTRGMKYIATSDSLYQPLRNMANQIKGLELVEK